jgi:hypothetical protein
MLSFVVYGSLFVVRCSLFIPIHSNSLCFYQLKQFYIGELHPADLIHVPPAGKSKKLAKPSNGFLKQLNDYTSWRVSPEDIVAHKSF